jgi:hypothetical protein
MVHQAQGQMVQEVAAAAGGLPTLPTRYVLREKDRPSPAGGVAEPELAFPTVDVQRLADPGDVEEADKLRSALQSWGLFKVRNALHVHVGLVDKGFSFTCQVHHESNIKSELC